MIIRFRLGNITEARPVHGKLDHHAPQGGNKTDLSNVTFPSSLKNTETRYFVLVYDTPFASIYRDFTIPSLC